MNETYHSLSELDESIIEKVTAIKNLIDHLRKEEYRNFTPVRHYPLSKIYNSCKIPADFDYRSKLTKSLKEVGFLETEGNLSGMKYRLKEGDFKKDSLTIATEINDLLYKKRRSSKVKFSHPRLAKPSNRDSSAKPVLIKKEFSLGEQVFLLKDNKIARCKIVALKYETFSQTSEDYPRIQMPVTIKYDNILCNVALPDNSIHTLSTHNIFTDIDLLLKSLHVRFIKFSDQK